ncbi:ABC transporter ATP-binding protein [Allorhodopirellula heiligendammensis]|uniref:P-loop containing nucleoside triphosphate hydrolase n=1 Tax=Allorhodopirellula heiligendammensis TaxID=2714739 RepID=A0A5C6C247_9BACT|nr:ABC transporter ATP-binding protein [Allorhodopirellula heiligendammensis]TWU16909.1 P-loop containing nucleoside triphosphate hydrolase [Allorhodopirellula heiligendammensis]|tara:strand:+ start:423 stop:1172 length:750 start_codon:yes stop_codon:yes gene_type:complete
MNPILEARGIFKSYYKNKIELPVLRGVDVAFQHGEVSALVGRSGSGKSTLMHLLATLDQPDAGEVWFGGERIDNLSRRQRDSYRNRQIGIIFQFYHLLPELSALENVLTPAMISRSVLGYFRDRKSLTHRAEAMLDRVGLLDRKSHKPSEMSGGEMQRVAIARSLMSEPELLLADEPTGNLDTETGESILQLLRQLNSEDGLTIVMITHDESIAERADRCYRMQDGLLVDRFSVEATKETFAPRARIVA